MTAASPSHRPFLSSAPLSPPPSSFSTQFDKARYADLLAVLATLTTEELVMAVRRQSQGFSRGTSTFRGVTAHPSGRWEARIGAF